MYYSSGNYEAFAHPLPPEGVENKQAYIIGSGLAGLAAACFLVRDGRMPGEKIHILERDPRAGGGCDGWDYPGLGYTMRGGREMDNHFEVMWDLFRDIPSIEDPSVSVLDYYYWLNKRDPNYSLCRATQDRGQDAHTDNKFNLSDKACMEIMNLFFTPEEELQDKVNAGEELTWEDLDGANWSVMGTSSPAGYIYPALWLQDHYGKGISDLSSAVQSDSYASAFARLASGQVDVLVTYADARRDYAERWNSEFGREGSIWEETGVIGVTAPIYNDTISVSKNSPIMDADLIAALQQAFINIGNTDAGKQVIAIYSHNGYQIAQSSDYDNERAAQKLIQELSAAN